MKFYGMASHYKRTRPTEALQFFISILLCCLFFNLAKLEWVYFDSVLFYVGHINKVNFQKNNLTGEERVHLASTSHNKPAYYKPISSRKDSGQKKNSINVNLVPMTKNDNVSL